MGIRAHTAIIALCVMLLSTPTTAGPAPVAHGGFTFGAEAQWEMRRRDTLYIYVVLVDRQTDFEGRDRTLAGIARNRCDVSTPRQCLRGFRSRVIAPEAFTFDPLLSEARLDVRWGRFRQTVTWTGVGNNTVHRHHHYAGPPYWLAPPSLGVGIANSRTATVRARLFGERLRGGGLTEAFLWYSGTVGFDSGP